MEFNKIEEKYKELIDVAKEYMLTIKDSEHDINHMNDVVKYTKMILSNMNEVQNIDEEACIIGAYWHDVGRTKIQTGHEKVSAQMLEEQMRNMDYDETFIKKCSDSIEFHKWNMQPKTIEGLVVKDADKIAWVGSGRWNSCIKNKQRLDSIIELLPRLRNEILYFEYAKKLYDQEIVKIVTILYEEHINKCSIK